MKKLILPKLIIFDWDNTLVDSWDIIHDAMMATFDKLPMKRLWHDKSETQKNGQYSLRHIFPKIFGDQAIKAGDIYYQEYKMRYLQQLRPLTDANIMLKKLQDKKICLAVISNKTHQILLDEIKHLGWENFFADAIGAGYADFDKPNPAPFLLLMKNIYGEKPPELDTIWYIGDMNVDVEFARNNGVVSVMIPMETLHHIPDRSVKNFDELLDLVDEIIL
ncbi:MAG: HAD family hydrolase [Alphaproteobacteria bacterium]